MQKKRCDWVTEHHDYIAYHDNEWGVPRYERQYLFEMLCLEGQQAGLSWLTVLKKRQAYRQIFHNFNPEKIVLIDENQFEILIGSTELIRNRLKLRSIIKNAQALLAMEAAGEIFSDFIWQFVNHQPIHQSYQHYRDAPVTSEPAKKLSKALKIRGFSFVGPVICHAFMQACGLIIDHQTDCFRYSDTNIYARKSTF